MIFITLTDGVTTRNVVDTSSILVDTFSGITKNGIFYQPQIISTNDVKFEADAIDRMQNGQFTLSVEGFGLFIEKDLTATISIWDEEPTNSLIEIFSGRAIRVKASRTQISYQIKTDKGVLGSNLLQDAPDLLAIRPGGWAASEYFVVSSNTYVEKRLFPLYCGALKYAPLFPLSQDTGGGTGDYYVTGRVDNLWENGLNLRFTQNPDATSDLVMRNNSASAPIYAVSLDISGNSSGAGSNIFAPEVVPLTNTFTQATEPLATDFVLKDGMIWIDISEDKNTTYIFSAGVWVEKTVNLIKSTDFVDIPTGTGFRLKSNAAGTSADPTIFGAYMKGGTLEGNVMYNTGGSDISYTMKIDLVNGAIYIK